MEGYIAAMQGRREEALAAADASLAEFRAGNTDLRWQVPAIYVALGMNDKAIDVLSMDGVGADMERLAALLKPYDPLRNDPRFTALLKRWGVTERLPRGIRP